MKTLDEIYKVYVILHRSDLKIATKCRSKRLLTFVSGWLQKLEGQLTTSVQLGSSKANTDMRKKGKF